MTELMDPITDVELQPHRGPAETARSRPSPPGSTSFNPTEVLLKQSAPGGAWEANTTLQPHRGPAETIRQTPARSHFRALQPHRGPAETPPPSASSRFLSLLQPHRGPAETDLPAPTATAPAMGFNPTEVLLKLGEIGDIAVVGDASTPQRSC